MIKFSLSSHRNKIRVLLYIVVAASVFLALVNISFSILLNGALKDAHKIAQETVPGLYFNARFAYFNLLRGVSIYGPELRKNDELIFLSRRADIGFDLLSLLKGKISIKNIRFDQTEINTSRISELSFLLDKELWNINLPVAFFDTTYFSGTNITLSDTVLADIKGYFSSIKGDRVISRGDILLKKITVPAFPDADIFDGSPFYDKFDYIFESQLEEGSFVIQHLEISNPDLKFTGSGQIEDAFGEPKVDLGIDFFNIILDNFPMLNSDRLKSRGVIDAAFNVSGSLKDLNAVLGIKITSAEVNFFDTLLLNKINGSAEVSRGLMSGKGLTLLINGMPFSADFTITPGDYPHLVLRLSSSRKIAEKPSFVLNLEADSLEKELAGLAQTQVRYLSSDSVNTIDFNLEDFRLGYGDGFFVNVANLVAGLTIEPLSASSKEKVKTSSISFSNPFCVLKPDKEGFSLGNLKGSCYGGTLEGKLDFTTRNDAPGIKGEAHLRGIELGQYFKNYKEPSYALSGKLDADLKFDTGVQDVLKGQLFVTDGVIQQNPILNAVSDFLGVASLKKVNFDELSIFFSGGKGEYSSKVQLKSPMVTGNLDGKISSYDKMDGYLVISLSTELLNESKQFRKILTYIRHDEPSVVFSFKISSYLASPRVLWLKNEFKDKLSNLLPERNKRYLQHQVNSLVESVETE